MTAPSLFAIGETHRFPNGARGKIIRICNHNPDWRELRVTAIHGYHKEGDIVIHHIHDLG